MSVAVKSRRPTNLSLDAELLAEARSLGVNLSRACEKGLAEEVARSRAAAWRADNAEAITSSNEFVAKHGLPLEALRPF